MLMQFYVFQVHSDAKRHADSASNTSKAWHQEFLSALIGEWTKTAIFIPREGDVAIPVGGMVMFSGSEAHAGIFFLHALLYMSHTIN
jgi:hypothetical protein